MSKVEADLNTEIEYAQSQLIQASYLPGYFIQAGVNPEESSVDGGRFYTFFENFTGLDNWKNPTYDDSKPSFDLKFTAAKTTDTPAANFALKHSASGDNLDKVYIPKTFIWNDFVSEPDYVNGSVSDTITANYGSGEKLSASLSKSISSKQNKDGDLTSYSYKGTQKVSLSSQGDPADKSDDYSLTASWSLSSNESLNPSNGKSTQSYTEQDDVKFTSSATNYSSSRSEKGNSSEIDGVYSSSYNISFKVAYSDYDEINSAKSVTNLIESDSGKWSYTNSDLSDLSWDYTTTYSKAEYSVKTDDGSINFSLIFTGSYHWTYGDIDTRSYNLKNIKLDDVDLNITTKTFNLSNSDADIDGDLRYFTPWDYGYLGDLNESLASIKHFALLAGDNSVTIKTDSGYELNTGNGNDTIVGGKGDDSITGGAGNDAITGGKGADTFTFTSSDFFTENSNGDLVYNKSVDTITDFKPSDGDTLDFGDLGSLEFYKSIAEAKSNEAQLFYTGGKVYLNTDTSGEKYTATAIISLVGNPKVNADFTDWDYPA